MELSPKYLTLGCSLTFKHEICQARGGGRVRGQLASGGPALGEAWQHSALSGGYPHLVSVGLSSWAI